MEDSRVEPLRTQARDVLVVGECACGCATIDLRVGPTRAEPAVGFERRPAIEARTTVPASDDPERGYELLLFLDNGWLSSMEIVYYGETIPTEFPPAGAWDAPFILGEPSTGGDP
jgi:hypothetical protein